MATGKHAFGLCDKCGRKVKYSELRRDGYSRGLWVCGICYDVKEPDEPSTVDKINLKHARPDPNTDRGVATPLANSFNTYFGGGT
jgi:hypothetical protein